ncbi:MAG: methyltransferase family protein [Bacteroidota bacterium]
MDQTLRLILPIYFVLYLGLTFVAKTVLVARRIGKNPLVLPNDDSAFGLIGFYFKVTLMAVFLYVIAFSVSPDLSEYLLPMKQLVNPLITLIGLGLLAFAFIWTIVAQSQMGNSWRIGIDANTETELVTTGLFRISRNPVFFGMIVCLAGLFLATPNALTGLFLILAYVLIQIQIRLEEEHLAKSHGHAYLNYRHKVRRLI